MKKVKRKYQFGKNQKKANDEGNDFVLSKAQIKRRLKEINKFFIRHVPQTRIIEKYGKPIEIKDEMIESVTKDFGGSAKYKTKEYIKNFCTRLADSYLLFSRCKEGNPPV